MKKLIFIFCLSILLSACAPSPEEIIRAIEETQAARPTETQTPLPTETPEPTSTPRPTNEPFQSSYGENDPETGITYVLEVGYCMMMIDVTDIQGPPKHRSGCTVKERVQHKLSPGFGVVNTIVSDYETKQWFCSLYSLDGDYIMTDFDTTGSGEVVCSP